MAGKDEAEEKVEEEVATDAEELEEKQQEEIIIVNGESYAVVSKCKWREVVDWWRRPRCSGCIRRPASLCCSGESRAIASSTGCQPRASSHSTVNHRGSKA